MRHLLLLFPFLFSFSPHHFHKDTGVSPQMHMTKISYTCTCMLTTKIESWSSILFLSVFVLCFLLSMQWELCNFLYRNHFSICIPTLLPSLKILACIVSVKTVTQLYIKKKDRNGQIKGITMKQQLIN